MVKVSILYPNEGDVRFDFKYYTEKHMPRSIELLQKHPGFKGVSVERGVAGPTPDSALRFVAMCHFHFTTADAFMEAFMPHAPELQGDIRNYTNIKPIVQINDVLIAQGQ